MYLCYDTASENKLVEAVRAHMECWNIPILDASCEEYEGRIAETNAYDLQRCIENEKYVIIILNKQLLRRLIALVELEMTKKLFHKGKIRVFVFLDNISEVELPQRIEWIKNTKIIHYTNIIDLHKGVFSIINVFLKDLYLQLSDISAIYKSSENNLNNEIPIKFINVKSNNLQKETVVENDTVCLPCAKWVEICNLNDEFINQVKFEYVKIDSCFTKVTMCYMISNHVVLYICRNSLIELMCKFIKNLYEYEEYSYKYENEILYIAENAMNIIMTLIAEK